MREGGPSARGAKRKPPRAAPEAPLTPVAENVLARAFAPEGPDRAWAADSAPPRRPGTHVSTAEGCLYLAVVGPCSVVSTSSPRGLWGGPCVLCTTARSPCRAHGRSPRPPPGPRPRLPLRSRHAVHVVGVPGAAPPSRGRVLNDRGHGRARPCSPHGPTSIHEESEGAEQRALLPRPVALAGFQRPGESATSIRVTASVLANTSALAAVPRDPPARSSVGSSRQTICTAGVSARL
jgi:hypothetical protein